MLESRSARVRDNCRENLEFPSLLELVAGYCSFAPGREIIRSLVPLSDPAVITRVHALTGEFQRRWAGGESFSCASADGVGPVVARLHVANLELEPEEIMAIRALAECGAAMRRSLCGEDADRFPETTALGSRFPLLEPLVSYIGERLEPDGSVPDHASPELAGVRRELRAVGEKIHNQYLKVMESADRRGYLQDRFVTSRNDRFVIPVRSEFQGSLGGVVHGSSSSGLTVFMEPLDMVGLNNTYIGLRDRETEAVRRVLAQVSAFLHQHREALEQALALLALVDSLSARGRFALDYRCTTPLVDENRVLVLQEARHPLLEKTLKAQGRKVVPISLCLTPAEPRLIVSGPNTGGKTAALKCAGLLALMILSGIPAPAVRAECAPFKDIWAVIGDRQSLTSDLSTFSAHTLMLKEILENYLAPSLILVDELCSGTDPAEGGALAQAILDRLTAMQAPFIVTTHSRTLKEYAVSTPGTGSAAVEFDPATLEPTYRLHTGALGGSYGLFIARRLGLPETVVDAAESRMTGAGLLAEEACNRLNELVRRREEELAGVARLRAETEEKRVELERSIEERIQREVQRIREEYRRLCASFDADRETLARECRSLAERTGSSRNVTPRIERLEKRLAEKVEVLLGDSQPGAEKRLDPVLPEELREGLPVFIGPLRGRGVVAEPGTDSVCVVSGGKKIQVPPAWLYHDSDYFEPAGPGPGSRPTAPPVSSRAALDRRRGGVASGPGRGGEEPESTRLGIPTREIKIIGKTVDEALPEVERFLDAAMRDEQRVVAVIHGVGKGILRAAVHQCLRETHFVKSFQHPPDREGGRGKTIVMLDV